MPAVIFRESPYCDLKIICGDNVEFLVHRVVMCRSITISNLMKDANKEKTEDIQIIHIPLPSEKISVILDYMYGRLKPEEIKLILFNIFDYFGMVNKDVLDKMTKNPTYPDIFDSILCENNNIESIFPTNNPIINMVYLSTLGHKKFCKLFHLYMSCTYMGFQPKMRSFPITALGTLIIRIRLYIDLEIVDYKNRVDEYILFIMCMNLKSRNVRLNKLPGSMFTQEQIKIIPDLKYLLDEEEIVAPDDFIPIFDILSYKNSYIDIIKSRLD